MAVTQHGRARNKGLMVNLTCRGCKGNKPQGFNCGAKLPGLPSTVMLGNPNLWGEKSRMPAGTATYDLVMKFTTCKKLFKGSWNNVGERRPRAGNAGYH